MYCDDVRLRKLSNNKSRNNKRDALFTTSHLTDGSSSDSSSSGEYVPARQTSNQQTPKASTGGNLIRAWERRGPVKLLRSPGDVAEGYLFFKNYKRLDYDGLKQLISKSGGSFLSMKELGDDYIKVRIKTEEDVRKLFFHLKKDKNYDVSVLLDLEDFREQRQKKRKMERIAKFKGYTLKEVLKTDEEILKAIAVTNQLESQIRFDMNSTGRRKPSSKVATEDNSSPKSGMIGTWRGHIVVMPDTPAPRLNIKPTDVINQETSTPSKMGYCSDNLDNSQKDGMLLNSYTDCLEPADMNTPRKNPKNYDVSVLLDMEDFREQRQKKRNCERIAKFKGISPKEAMKTDKDILKAIAVANQLDSEIRFDMNSTGRRKPSSKVATEDNSSPKSGMIGTWRGHIVVMPDTPAPRLNIKPTDVINQETSTPSKMGYCSDNLDNSQKDGMLLNSYTDCLEPADMNTPRKNPKNYRKSINKNDGNNNVDIMFNKSTGSNKKVHSIKTLPDTEDGSKWETSSFDEFLECYNRLRIRSACRKKQLQRQKGTSTGHLSYDSTSLSDMSQLKEEPAGPGLTSIFDLHDTYLRKRVLDYYSTSLSDMSQLKEEPAGPGPISIFDLYANYLRKCVLDSLETSIKFVEK